MGDNALDNALALYESKKRIQEETEVERLAQSQQAVKAKYDLTVCRAKDLLASSGITEDIQKSMKMSVYPMSFSGDARFIFHYKSAEIRLIASDSPSVFYGSRLYFKGGLKKYRRDLKEDLSDAFFSSVKEIDRIEKLGIYAKLIAWREQFVFLSAFALFLGVSMMPIGGSQKAFFSWFSLIPASAMVVSACRHQKIDENPEWRQSHEA